MTINELRQKKARLITEARAYQTEREKAGSFTADDKKKVDEMIDAALDIDQDINREERLAAQERTITAAVEEAVKPDNRESGKEYRNGRGEPITEKQYRESLARYERYLRGDISNAEMRALEAGSDTAGGFTLPSQELSQRLLKLADDQVFVRRISSVETLTKAESLGMVGLTDPADFDWTSELLTGSEDSTMAFSKRELRPHPLAKRIKVSRKLLRSSSRNVVDLINERFGYKFSITMEKAYLTGDGYQKPLGAFVASADGINTDRDFVGGSSTALTAAKLKEIKYTLKGAYMPNARWLFHRDGVKQIAGLRDEVGGAGTGQFMFDVDNGRFMNLPLDMSEYVPNTFTSGLYVGMLADWRTGYTIVDCLDMTIQRLEELYAETNQVGFIARYEGDGAPVQPEAFVRIKLG